VNGDVPETPDRRFGKCRIRPPSIDLRDRAGRPDDVGGGPKADDEQVARRSAKTIRLARIREGQEIEKVADRLVLLGRVAHLRVSINRVVVAPADLLALDKACLDKVGDDSLGGTFSDSDPLCYVTQTHVSVTSDAEEYLGVVRDEPPRFPIPIA
jgi:hypothetical protein